MMWKERGRREGELHNVYGYTHTHKAHSKRLPPAMFIQDDGWLGGKPRGGGESPNIVPVTP